MLPSAMLQAMSATAPARSDYPSNSQSMQRDAARELQEANRTIEKLQATVSGLQAESTGLADDREPLATTPMCRVPSRTQCFHHRASNPKSCLS